MPTRRVNHYKPANIANILKLGKMLENIPVSLATDGMEIVL